MNSSNNITYKLSMYIQAIIIILVIIVLLVFIFTTSKSQILPIVGNVDLTKYQGTWYEIARLPATFQQGCTDATATYTLNTNKTINVINRCRINNNIIQANGIGYPVFKEVYPGSNIYPGSFNIDFGYGQSISSIPRAQPLESDRGNYNIIKLDPSYQYVMVGTSDRNNLWILSRTISINSDVYNDYINTAKQLGYPINRLIINNWEK